MQKVINKGFTLIELLVVIAIIGILASIVLVSLGNARSKGADAGIQGNLDSIRTQAELYSSNNDNNYGVALATTSAGTVAACIANNNLYKDPTITQALTSAQTTSGGAITCAAGPYYWAVAVVLKSDPAQAWCVSSGGQAKTISATSPLTAANSCL